MNEIPPEGFDDEEDDEWYRLLDGKIDNFLKNLTSSQRENIPELQALFTMFLLKEDKFDSVLEMLRQSIKELSVDPNYLANWRSLVQAKLRETSNEELGIDDSQRQQFERVLLGLDE